MSETPPSTKMPKTQSLSTLKVAGIRKELQARGLETKGVKAQLIQRLTAVMRGEGLDPENFVPQDEIETSPVASADNTVDTADQSSASVDNAEVSCAENDASTAEDTDTSILPTEDQAVVETIANIKSELISPENSMDDGKDEGEAVLPVENVVKSESSDLPEEAGEVEMETTSAEDPEDQSEEKACDTEPETVPPEESEDQLEQPDLAETEAENVQTITISETDDDADQDALRLTIGDEEAIGEYDFQEYPNGNDDDEITQVEKEENLAKGNKSSVSESVKGKKDGDNKERSRDDLSKPQSVLCVTADGKTETVPDSLLITSTSSNENKTSNSEEGSPDAKRKEANVVVVNELCANCTASEIKSIFQKYGKIVGVKVISNNKTTGSRRFAHVEMTCEEDVSKCVAKSNDIQLHGHQLKAQRASVDGSPAKKGSKSDHSNGSVDEHKSSQTKMKTSEERKGSSVAGSSPSNSSKIKEVDKKEKLGLDKKSKDSSSNKESSGDKDSLDKDKGKEKSKDHSGKADKDKKSPSSKDSKSKSEMGKGKSGADVTPTSSKSGNVGHGHKVPVRKDPRERYIPDRRVIPSSRASGFQRGNEAARPAPYNRPNNYRPQLAATYQYRGRVAPRSPQLNLSRQCLTFDKIREHRERERMRENERKVRERERRRREEEEKQRLIEKRNKEEFLALERERQQLRMEREKVERDKLELLRIQQERQRTERENIEKEREELRRAQLKIEEHRRLLKRPFVDNKDYLDRKKPLMTDILRFEATSRPDTFMPRHETKLESRGEGDRHDRSDPRLDRGNMQRPNPRDFNLPSARAAVRHSDRDDDWSERTVSRDPRTEAKKTLHSDDRRAVRLRGRVSADLADEYAGSYRPSSYVPMKISDHFQSDKDYGRTASLERKIPPSSSALEDALMPSHFATDRSKMAWSSNRKSEPTWTTSDKYVNIRGQTVRLTGRSAGHYSSGGSGWSSMASSSALSGTRASENIMPTSVGLQSASSSLYPSVSGSSAAASGSSGRSSHMYSGDEFASSRFRRF